MCGEISRAVEELYYTLRNYRDELNDLLNQYDEGEARYEDIGKELDRVEDALGDLESAYLTLKED